MNQRVITMPVSVLVPVDSVTVVRRCHACPYGGAWSPDGTKLFAGTTPTPPQEPLCISLRAGPLPTQI